MKERNMDTYRWFVLIASCLVNLCVGSLYAWSVFATPMAEKLAGITGEPLTAASLAIVFTVANAIGPVSMITGGFINDRVGPKWVILVGGVLFGCGMIGSSLAPSIPVLLITYGLGCGLGQSLAYGCTVSNSVKFFPEKRGLIGGIATATYGLGSVILPPIANALIASLGVSRTFQVLGIFYIVVVTICSLFISKCPAGYAPKGYVAPTTGRVAVAADKNWKQMIADPIFYVMLVMLLCGGFSGLMITSQASPMAQKLAGMSVGMAATVVSTLALFNAGGRVVAGFLSDKLGRINVLLGTFVLEVIGLVCLLNSGADSAVLFLVGVCIMGICFGSLMGVYPGFTADQFGGLNNSLNYGIMFIGFGLAGIGGPMVVGKIVSATGSYSNAFYVAMILAALGILLSCVYRVLRKKAA